MPRIVTHIAGITETSACAHLCRTAVRTHQATALADSELHFWHHGGDEPRRPEDTKHFHFESGKSGKGEEFQKECAALGVRCQWRADEYHHTRWLNEFARVTDSEFLVWATADCLFFPGWMEALLAAAERCPELHTLHPVSFSAVHQGLGYVEKPGGAATPPYQDERVIPTNVPLCHVIWMRRAEGYVWDEHFPFWEADMDYHCWLQARGRQAGIVRDSRVDHLDGSTMRDSNTEVHRHDSPQAARRRLEKKWGLPEVE